MNRLWASIREAIASYRWLWRAQLRWRPQSGWVAGITFAARVIRDLTSAAVSAWEEVRMIPDRWIQPIVTSLVLAKRAILATALLVVALVVSADGGAVAERARSALERLHSDRMPAVVPPHVTINSATTLGDVIRDVEWSPVDPPVLSRDVELQVDRAMDHLLSDRRPLPPFLAERWDLRRSGGVSVSVPVLDGEGVRVRVEILVEDPFRPEEPPRVLNPEWVGQVIVDAYPAELREQGLGVTIPVQFMLDATGEVEATRIVQASQFEALDRAALNVASEFRFSPAVHSGTAVASSAISAIAFR